MDKPRGPRKERAPSWAILRIKGSPQLEDVIANSHESLNDADELQKQLDSLRAKRTEIDVEIARLETSLRQLEIERLEATPFSEEPSSAHNTGPVVTKSSSLQDKFALFTSLFAGRSDLHAKRFQSSKTGKSGYSPVCSNEFKRGFCTKGQPARKRIKCINCEHQLFPPITEDEFQAHLLGKSPVCSDVLAAYAIDKDNLCNFIVADFDCKSDGMDSSELHALQKTAIAFLQQCMAQAIPAYLERSRSGKGFHIWTFFQAPLPAQLARHLYSAVLTRAMEQNPEINFDSYDRFIPHQDSIPSTGFGSLIALPFQGKAGKNACSIFLDEKLIPFPDQWELLSHVEKINEQTILAALSSMGAASDLGALYKNNELSDGPSKPWEQSRLESPLTKNDFTGSIEIVIVNMIHVSKKHLSARACNRITRLAAFPNPEFYEFQRMRLDTWGKPRIISTADNSADYISLPRGIKDDLIALLNEAGAHFTIGDKTNKGRPIELSFTGKLRDAQAGAVEALLAHSTGVLSATTGFGKTVVAANLIARRRVNTLVLVNNKNLLTQWVKELTSFLHIESKAAPRYTPTGREREVQPIGEFSGSKKITSNIIDIAMLQSLSKNGKIDEIVKNYGMVIVDECHHLPAFSFEEVMKAIPAAYVYGLSATPKRKDGHQPIIFMQCGPIRYHVDAMTQAKQRPFEQVLVPRFTTTLIADLEDKPNFAKIYRDLACDERRNDLIVRDVVQAVESGRNPLVLSELTDHVSELGRLLSERLDNVIPITGKKSIVEKRDAQDRIQALKENESFVIVATGKYIGEGFDFSRLDTLFLALPISWEGRVAQYTGRLHRLHEGKTKVEVYDYVDVRIPVLDRMYRKRLKAYKSGGYKAVSCENTTSPDNVMFDSLDYQDEFARDCAFATESIVVFSPYLSSKPIQNLSSVLESKHAEGVPISVLTKAREDSSSPVAQRTQRLIQKLEQCGATVSQINELAQKAALIDRRIVWYGGLNLLGANDKDDVALRLVDPEIATALLEYFEESR